MRFQKMDRLFPGISVGAVQEWIGKMVAKAVGGSWHVTLDAAAILLAEAIRRFYGW